MFSVKSWEQKESGYSKLSKLYVANVNNHDSGLYTCSMGKVRNATVFVSVYVQGTQTYKLISCLKLSLLLLLLQEKLLQPCSTGLSEGLLRQA